MKFGRTHHYPAPAEQVLAMLLDPAFREAVCREQEALACEVSVSAGSPPATVGLRLQLSMQGAPAVARKITGDTVHTEQEETWDTASSARLRIVIPGKPGRLTGRISLTDNGDGTCTEQLDAEVKVDLPFVGGKLEPLIARVLGSGLRREREVGLRWLAGDRS